MWLSYNELAKFSGHNNADIQANFQLHTDLSLITSNFKTDQQRSDFKEKQGAILFQFCT